MSPRFDPARQYTYGETLSPAMEVQTQEEADAYLEDLTAWHVARHGMEQDRARALVRESLGYWTGYWNRETAERVFRLFGCAHPVFGKTQPTPEQAFGAGVDMARARGGS